MKKALMLLLCLGFNFVSSQNLTSSLTACYALDGSATEPINGLTGTLSAVTSTVNRFNTANSAYYFTGATNSFIKLPDDPLLKPTNGVSFSAWINLTSTIQPIQFVAVTQNIFTSNNFEAYALGLVNYGSGHKFRVMKGDGAGNTNFTNSSTTILQNTWYHVAFTVDNSSLIVYVNGVLESTATTTFAFNYKVGEYVYLGGSNSSPCCYLPFTGIIDNARFYNRVLTATEVGLLYASDPACTPPLTPPTVAAFNAPDTVCVNQSFSVTNTSTGSISSYYWSACGSTLAATPQATNLGNIGSFNQPVSMSINKDGGNYYMFVANHIGGTISRVDFGSSLNNAPTFTNLGTLSNNVPGNPMDIDIEKEGSNWYGFVIGGPVGADRITRLDFGTSLGNIPTATNMGNIGGMNFPHSMQIFKAGGNYYAYINNRSGNSISLLSFGSSLSNTPTGINLGNIGNMNGPGDYALFNYNGSWYAYITNDLNNTITRLNFGPSLLSIPTGTNIGNTGGLNGPRGIAVGVGCANVKGWITNLSATDILELTILSNGTATSTSLGNMANFSWGSSIERYRIGDTMALFITNVMNNTISRINYPSCNAIPSSTLQNPAPMTFTAPGTYTLSLACNEVLYDQSSYCKIIYVSPLPTISATSSSSALCSGASVTLQANGASTYSWQPINLTGSIVSANPVSTTVYTVTGSNAFGCTSSSTLTVAVNLNLSISAVASPSDICSGNSSILTANGGVSYTWQPLNLTGSSVTVSPSSSTIYTVISTNSAGCAGSYTLAVNVSTTPIITAVANPTTICSGNNSTLTATGASGYTWMPGNLTGSSVVVSPGSLTIYTVTGATGICISTTTVSVATGLFAQIFSSGSLCNNSSITLFASPSGTLYNYIWVGPGITGLTSPSVTISAGGTYSVGVINTLTGCSGTATSFVTNNTNPISLNITPSSTLTCFPGPAVNILVNASANLNWLPSAEVTPNTGPLVSVSPSVTSTYTVLATLGSCTGSAAITISVTNTPTVLIPGGPQVTCSGAEGILSATGAGDYVWLPGNVAGSTISISPPVTTIYTVTGFNGNCSATNTVTVNVLPSPILTTTVSPITICIGHTSTLTAAGADNLFWLVTDLPASSPTAIVNPTLTTTYTVVGTNSLGCSSTATTLLQVINSPAISALSSSSVICEGETLTLTASGANSYTWFPGYIFGNTIVVSPTVSTTYTVISGVALCSYANALVLVNTCVNTSFGLTNNAEEPEEYNGTFFKVRFTVTMINNSTGDLRDVMLNDLLESTFAPPISYTVISAPTITSQNSSLSANTHFDGRTDISLVSPASSTLSANTRDTITFAVMVDPNGFKGVLKNSVIGFAKDKNNLIVSDSSNNGFLWDPDGDGDPTNNNEITLITIPLMELFIPDGFSPDGDGNNDHFLINGLNDRSVNLIIFNRWGNKVYEKNNYDNSWDGTPNVGGAVIGNGKLPEGTYYYILQFSDGKKELKTGFIVLRR